MISQLLIKNWKNVALIGLAIFCIFSVRTCSINKWNSDALENNVSILRDSVKTFKGKNGELVSQVRTHELTIDQLKEYGDNLGIENESLKKQVGNLNRLVGYWRIKASVRDTFTVKETDTIYVRNNVPVHAKAFHYNNGYLTLDQLYHPEDGTMSTLYDYKLDFEITVYRKGQNLFRLGTLVSDIRFKDQNLSVTEMTGISVKKPPDAWWNKGVTKFLFGVAAGFYLGSR